MSNLKNKKKSSEDVTENFYKSLMMDSEEIPSTEESKPKVTKRPNKKKNEEPKNTEEENSTPETKTKISQPSLAVVRKKKKSSGPSFLSLYFFVPSILLTVVHVVANFYWHRTFYTIFRETLLDTFGYTLSFWEPMSRDRSFIVDAWSSFVFLISVLYIARGSMLRGFFSGIILSTAFAFNLLSLTYIRLKEPPIEHMDTILADFAFQVCMGGFLGQFAVFIASLCIPSKSKSE